VTLSRLKENLSLEVLNSFYLNLSAQPPVECLFRSRVYAKEKLSYNFKLRGILSPSATPNFAKSLSLIFFSTQKIFSLFLTVLA